MSGWIIPPMGELCEITATPEIYVDGIGAIEKIGNCIRIYGYVEQRPLMADAPMQKVVAVKLIGPIANVPATIIQLGMCAAGRIGFKPHMVR